MEVVQSVDVGFAGFEDDVARVELDGRVVLGYCWHGQEGSGCEDCEELHVAG